MIHNIIFDIGNVLAGFDWESFILSFGYSQEEKDRIAKATVKSSWWHEFDRGSIAEEEIIQGFIENDPPMEAAIRRLMANTHGIVVRYDYAIPWIKELKEKGYRVFVLSNFSEKSARECEDALDFLPYTDGGILSYQDKVIKPQPEIYELLLKRYGLIAGECVFLDDLQVNLDGAERFGIHTILFKNRLQAVEELKKLGVQ